MLGNGSSMRTIYELVLQDGLNERRMERTFMKEIHPGTQIHLDEEDWVVIGIHKRAHAIPEAVAVPAKIKR